MKRLFLIMMMVLLSFAGVQAQTKETFSYLKWQKVIPGDPYCNYYFGYNASGVAFSFDGRLQQDLPNGSPLKNDSNYTNEDPSGNVYLGCFQKDKNAPKFHLFFSQGPSVDPTFSISDQNFNHVWECPGEELAITDLGTIYVSGETNKMFNMRQKFQFSQNGITEVPQPYYYVGLKDKLMKSVKLYSQKEGGRVVATLPKGYMIEVLLAAPKSSSSGDSYNSDRFLVATEYGLVGWMRLSIDEQYPTENRVSEHLYYHGD